MRGDDETVRADRAGFFEMDGQESEGRDRFGRHVANREADRAAGAGVQVQEVNRMLTQFEQMQTMMKKLSGGGMMKMMRSMKGMMPGMR